MVFLQNSSIIQDSVSRGGFPHRISAKQLQLSADNLWVACMPEKRSRTLPPPKEPHLDNFSGLRKSFRAGGRYNNPLRTQGDCIYHRIFASVDPIYYVKQKFVTLAGAAGRSMFGFNMFQHVKTSEPSKELEL